MLIVFLVTSPKLYAGDAQAPDMVLLEFIGEEVSAGNELVDPLTWQEMQQMQGDESDKTRQSDSARPAQTEGKQRHE